MGNVWERKDLLYALERAVSSEFLDDIRLLRYKAPASCYVCRGAGAE
jgi:hypothetical protein